MSREANNLMTVATLKAQIMLLENRIKRLEGVIEKLLKNIDTLVSK